MEKTLHDSAELVEKLILIGVRTDDTQDVEGSLNELSELVRTAGAETVGYAIQSRETVHPGTYIGKGKIEEVREMIRESGATGVVCDDELSPAQMKNLEDGLDTKVLDRTILILDIFATRATTREGKIQVELAQARYSLTRLAGFGTSMSRLGGGIGTRGPGESKLETDRRRTRARITQLKQELADVMRQRSVNRTLREKNAMPVVAIVGYTNAGKSTLLNRLTGASVLSENKLFATLDPTTRVLTLPSGQHALLTDTVGFIKKLPHHLIEAFRSTLEEAKYADVIVHVTDASNPDYGAQMDTVYRTLNDLQVKEKPILTLFNKCDRLTDYMDNVQSFLRDPKAEKALRVSALTGEGLDAFLSELEKMLNNSKVLLEKVFPFTDAGKIQKIRKYGTLLEETYREDGIYVRALVPVELTEPKPEEY